MPRSVSPARRFFNRIVRKKIAMIAVAYLAVFYFAALFAPFIAPHDPNLQNFTIEGVRQGPSWDHLLGTDALGRDIFSRVLFAARTTTIFTVAVLVTGGIFLGLGLGLLAGYKGGWIDTAIMRVGEVLAGLPTLILIIAIAAAFRTRIDDFSFWLQDHTFLNRDDAGAFVDFLVIVGVTVPFAWVGGARIVRSQALYLREADFVLAAEVLGASTPRILFRHILPGVIPLFVVGLSSGMAGIAGTEVALSFLGLGVDPPVASFGTLIGDGAGVRTFQAYPHLLLGAAVPVVLFFFAWNLLGDALVDLVEVRTSPR
jgi:ABC-type dipeptide/oligopeptide/nickel transport system permease subunit